MGLESFYYFSVVKKPKDLNTSNSMYSYMNDPQKKLDKKEKLRREALSSQNPVDYYALCKALGIKDVEDEHLYELGEMELQEQRKKEIEESKLEKKINHALREKEFLRRAEEININDFNAHTDAKKGFLTDYFPGRFGPGSKQDIEDYDPTQIGALFKNVYDSYTKKHYK